MLLINWRGSSVQLCMLVMPSPFEVQVIILCCMILIVILLITGSAEDTGKPRKNSFVGTAQYVSPEVLRNNCSYYR